MVAQVVAVGDPIFPGGTADQQHFPGGTNFLWSVPGCAGCILFGGCSWALDSGTGIPLSFVRYFFVLRSKFRILAGHIALPYVRESRAVENRAISAEPAALSFCDLHYNDSWETQL